MAKILWLNWSGGGNLPPSLGIARALTERGHSVAFAGRPEMVPRVERAGFRAIELTRAYEQVDQYPKRWMPRAASFLSSPATAEQIRAVVAAERPDLVVVDAMFPAALTEAAHFDGPVVVMCQTFLYRLLATWRNTMAMIVGMRVDAGFPALPSDLDTLWMSRDRVLVSTLDTFDGPPPGGLAHPEKVRHVGPVLEREKHGARVALPWPDDDPAPLVLVSFSTAPEQGSVAKFQNAIDALAALPVHGVVTVGDSVDPAALKPAENVVVFATADHDDLMRRAALVVTHGGHGTLMRALAHGLPDGRHSRDGARSGPQRRDGARLGRRARVARRRKRASNAGGDAGGSRLAGLSREGPGDFASAGRRRRRKQRRRRDRGCAVRASPAGPRSATGFSSGAPLASR